jgi:hypothetical protein
MEKAQKASNYECYTPSSEPFRIFMKIKIYKAVIYLNCCSRWAKNLVSHHKGRMYIESLDKGVPKRI